MSSFNSNIPFIIKQLLREGKEVYLPNLGTLYPVMKSAQMVTGSNKITPPECDFVFSESGSENGNLVQRLLANKLANVDNVDSIIQQYSAALFDEIYKNGSSDISGVGKISADGKEVSFDYDQSLLKNHFKSLKALYVKPTATRVEKQIPVIKQPINKEKSSGWFPVIFGLTIGFLLLGILYSLKYISFAQFTEHRQEAEKTENVKFANAQTVSEDFIPVLDTLDTYTQEVDYVIDEETKTVTHNYVIVTGSLTKGQNVEEMVGLLKALDYEVVTKEHKSLTRVGVLLSCDEINVNDYLKEIKTKISNDAWILDSES